MALPINPRALRPSQVVQLLNSTPLGAVLTERQLHRHRARAGFRIGDGRTIDLLRYVAWMVGQRHTVAAAPPAPELTGYDAYKERQRQRMAEQSLSGRDITNGAWVHRPLDPPRKIRAARDLRFFLEAYLPASFPLPWSPDHLKVITKLEHAVLEGGLFAMAMPRGSGKTTLCEGACLWALSYGHREFAALIGATEPHAEEMLESIKSELENNELLEADFSEVVGPIRALEGIHQRASGQLYQGRQTHIGWTARDVVLPTLLLSDWLEHADCRPFLHRDGRTLASGAAVRVAGLTGRVRGMKHKRTDGTSIRPALVLIDDPQTEESARSPSQCAARERILAGAILGLAGPGRKIAGLMTLTVICPGDLADRLLDRDKHPQWQGERTKMVYAFPKHEALWTQYGELRRQAQQEQLSASDVAQRCNEFYRAHQAELEAGAVVAWPARHAPDEVTAIQHAMNLRIDRKDHAFFAEYQNEPLPIDPVGADELTADEIAAKVNGHARGLVPLWATHLTAFVDVQAKALFWLVAAWGDDFIGAVVDYGTEPEQRSAYFTLREIRRTLATAAPRAGLEGAIYAGLERRMQALLGREWRREDGAQLRIDRCLVDANWGSSTDVVYQFCRQSRYAGLVLPAHGRYVGASSIPFSEYKRKRGDRVGLNWRIPLLTGKRAVRHVLFDANYWKTFCRARLAVPLGDPGCLSLFGRQPEQHQLLAEHLVSEYCVKPTGRGRTVDEWKLRQDGTDNHWWDCLVGAAVAASVLGVTLFGTDAPPTKRKRVRWSELQRAKR